MARDEASITASIAAAADLVAAAKSRDEVLSLLHGVYAAALTDAIDWVDAVRNDHSVPLDDEADAVRRLLDRRRLAALTRGEVAAPMARTA